MSEDLSNISPERLEEFINNGGLLNLSNTQDNEKGPAATLSPIEPTVSIQSAGEQFNTKESSNTIQSDSGEIPSIPTRAEGFDFKDPVELLFFLDDDVGSGKVILHDWQIRIMMDFAAGGVDDEHPFQGLVRACNGSGKDKYVIAPCAVWLSMRYIQARCVVTSSSGDQLDNQTDTYINQLCVAVNRKIDPKIWKINYRYYECLPTGSPIKLYATDEPLKAEGYHPLVADGKMGIFMSEAKSIPDSINAAVNKCTGYTHRLHVSTPGLPMGHFHDYCSVAVDRKTIKSIFDVSPIDYIQYHITAYECSHLSRNYIEQCKRDLPGGELGAAFKSQVLAEFGTTDEMVVIPYTYVWRFFKNTVAHISEPYNKAGLDLSDGGDETVLTIRNGNKLLKVIPFKFDNTEDTIAFLNEKFRENNLNHPEAFIYADCGGLGKPMLDRMKRQGWSNIRYVDNRSRAYYPTTYTNRGSETWFHLRKLLERNELTAAVKDDKLSRQLATRYYKITPKNQHQLLSKLESRSRGYPSPDRADSLVLAFCDYKSTFIEVKEGDEKNAPFTLTITEEPVSSFTIKQSVKEAVDQPSRFNQSTTNKGNDYSIYRHYIDQHNRELKLCQTQSLNQ